jgi:hypothetical protein
MSDAVMAGLPTAVTQIRRRSARLVIVHPSKGGHRESLLLAVKAAHA